MSPAVVLAIVVATQNVDDQATESMRTTAAEALGGEDYVVVREVDETDDSETLRIERLVRAQTVAQIAWLDAAHTRARVRVHVAETDRWTERTMVFAVVDTATERGRALGFAVTSMLPEEALAANPHHRLKRSDDAGPEPELRTAVRLVALGSTGLGGTAGGYGGSIAGEFFVTQAIAARLGFAGRQGAVPALNGHDLASYAALGVSFWPRRSSPDRRLAVGIRVDALVLNHSVTYVNDKAANRQLSKWLPGIDALAEIALSVSSAVDVVTSLGIEAALGSSEIDIDAVPVDTIPALRGVGEVGIRISF
jgi:hypothetical protein